MTSPNPMVGAVLVHDGAVVAEDYHRKAGTPHAEALVIRKAGDAARGSTLYVNLEPCCHTEKRTPPCTREIINAGVSRVVIAMRDPNPKVSGKGIVELERAGIEVVSGICEEEARKLNEAYIKYITSRRPFVTLKIAMTLDGKIATPDGQSRWITGELSRRHVHLLRSSVDAILTAIGTVKADDPQLTVRLQRRKSPKRIVIDPNLEISTDAKILKTPPETTIVTKSLEGKKGLLEARGISFIHYDHALDLRWLMGILGQQQVTSVLIEGGSSLNAHALEDGIVDKILIYIAPKIIGGKDSFPAVGGKTYRRLEEAYRIRDMRARRVGEDILIEGYVR